MILEAKNKNIYSLYSKDCGALKALHRFIVQLRYSKCTGLCSPLNLMVHKTSKPSLTHVSSHYKVFIFVSFLVITFVKTRHKKECIENGIIERLNL